jgi:hypothetical protein
MPLASRALYELADALVGAPLREHGFVRADGGDYQRTTTEGMDRILLDPNARKGKFTVFASHYPADLEFITDFLHGEDRGFPVGPYVTQRGVFRHPYTWPYKTKEQTEGSLRKLLTAIEEYVLPWLQSLRDPVVYAKAVDVDAPLFVAVAWERAGDIARAREAYEQRWETFAGMLASFDERFVIKEAGEQVVFVAEKLGRQRERMARFREMLGYTRPVKPLGT